jgi:DNA ligase-1
VRRGEEVALWSRGDELVTERFPEIESAGRALAEGTVVDGEILAWSDAVPLPFGLLQRRITRKALTNKILREIPVRLVAYDLLEHRGVDVRCEPFEQRRVWLEEIIAQQGAAPAILISPVVSFSTWAELADQRELSRARGAEGLMIKRVGSPYRVGRVRGDWWKWKVAPFTVDAVLTAARRGSGKRASLYTDYTFSVWDNDLLVPFAQAYSGLDDEEIREVDGFIRAHMREKFGPVRSVEPRLVFEIAFEGIQRSSRHKSGVAVRFPRIQRWRRDKTPEGADTIESIRALLGPEGGGVRRSQGSTGSTTREGLLFDL